MIHTFITFHINWSRSISVILLTKNPIFKPITPELEKTKCHSPPNVIGANQYWAASAPSLWSISGTLLWINTLWRPPPKNFSSQILNQYQYSCVCVRVRVRGTGGGMARITPQGLRKSWEKCQKNYHFTGRLESEEWENLVRGIYKLPETCRSAATLTTSKSRHFFLPLLLNELFTSHSAL